MVHGDKYAMDHSHVYNQLIKQAQGRTRPIVYTEKHHIVPRCLGGSNDKSNLVYLTAREHLLAHKLLDKIYPDNRKIFFALWSMLTMKNDDMKRIPNSREYEKAKIRMAAQMSQIQKGRKRPPQTELHRKRNSESQLGKVLSEETKSKIREKRKLQITTDETRAKISASGSGENNAFFGKKHTEETRALISKNNASCKQVSCDGVIYDSMAVAAKALGFARYETVKKRCESEKYPDWFLISKGTK